MTRRQRIGLKVVVWAGCLAPLTALVWRLFTDPLVTNPIDVATDTLGGLDRSGSCSCPSR